MAKRIQTFEAFWPYYLGEHSKPATRWVHFFGTNFAVVALVMLIATQSVWWFPAGLVGAYGAAWVSHFFIEKNRPATFTYPTWSLAADFKMCWFMWRGKIDEEIARVRPPIELRRAA